MKDYFADKVALVTGAAMGMGFATARAFAEEGARVVLSDISQSALDEAVQTLKQEGHDVTGILCDVSREDQVASLVEQTVATYGRLDAAFNNAGVQSLASETADATSEEFNRVNSINLFGVWCCMKYELMQMRKQGSGAIVNCSSLGGLVGLPGRSIYHGTKHGVVGMTKSTALEYASQGIRVNAVCPGTIDTPMVQEMVDSGDLPLEDVLREQPIGRLGKPEEIASAVVWLCGPGSTFVIGHSLPVDGGFTAH
ncbi:NAD(P)-dependent dehydrogenase, short-chain alcohol dehydrogenase family [Kushneria avicenniae]|uniref:NAD(P)-dependent dehydrogenase, short-chain alcohol dehydrogenase family n=1 Tax=Kushneria avicenniae TaxID=402385 RepID=A0A1I1GAG0_9GAMM|nr:glucose 1-dehydrogenase [Kushneria avicenniae]SFC06323.1 NAD(P)-dependent dehydrogenase, short-chain alcohol dehydrogenase family [Kushneria avicenniae]